MRGRFTIIDWKNIMHRYSTSITKRPLVVFVGYSALVSFSRLVLKLASKALCEKSKPSTACNNLRLCGNRLTGAKSLPSHVCERLTFKIFSLKVFFQSLFKVIDELRNRTLCTTLTYFINARVSIYLALCVHPISFRCRVETYARMLTPFFISL
jgi:hypothetical protein